MNEEEKENMQNSIEKKYQNITEKGILNNLTYAECLFILTPENKYCDKIKELSLLKICEIFEKLQKENEELKYKYNKALSDVIAGVDLDNTYISKQKVKDKIEELNRKIDKSIDNSKGGLDEEFIEKAGELLTQKRILQELLESEE